MMSDVELGCSGSNMVARLRSNNARTLVFKAQADEFTQGRDFAKVSRFPFNFTRISQFHRFDRFQGFHALRRAVTQKKAQRNRNR